MHNFKVGDKVVGKPEASQRYHITGHGWEGKVIARGVGYITVVGSGIAHGVDVIPKYFALVEEQTTDELVEENRSLAKQIEKLEERLERKKKFFAENAERIRANIEEAYRDVLNIEVSL